MKQNVLATSLQNILSILVSFFAQKIFLHFLNTEYLGLNGLFSNIISMLAIFELGIGSAITFSLYKPLAKGDRPTIKALMNFYKKAYRIIAIIVTVVGVAITPFLPFLIKEVTVDINIYVVYLMFLADVVCSYLLTYRRSILYADQKNYQISYIHIGYLVIMNALQLGILAITHNYYLYLGIKIAMRIVENLAIHFVVRKQYPYLNNLENAKLDKKLEKDIFKKIKALLFHKIGGFIVLGSDNIIISKFIGLVEVGLYSNYYLIYKAGEQLIGQAISALTPTVGHKLATEESEKSFGAFRKTRFAGFCMACFAATLFFTCMQSFVKVWLGEKYLLSTLTLAMIALNLFQRLQRYAFSTFKEAAGIYHEDRFIPLVESVLNIVASIILLKIFGLAGVFMGTTISGLALWCYSYPRFVYKKLFKRSYWQYARETLGYIAVFVLSAGLSYLAISQIHLGSAIMQIIANAGISVGITGAVIVLALHRTGSFRFFVGMVKGRLAKLAKRLLCRKNMKKRKDSKTVLEYPIIHLMLLVISGIGLARVLPASINACANSVRVLMECFCPTVLNLPLVSYCVLFIIDLVIYVICILLILAVLCKSCVKRVKIRDANYIFHLLNSNNSGEPASNRMELAKRIYGSKRNGKNVPNSINKLINKSISPIKRFLIGDDEDNNNILMINAKWGAGKTTCLLIAINEAECKENRYIYESAFKYRVNRNELFDDVLTALRETLSEFGIKTNNSIDSIIRNLDKDASNTLLGVLKKRGEVDALSSDAIYRINEKYRKSKVTNKLFVIIDDLDRMSGDDIVNILSFLSILRRLEFVRIIIPADRAAITGALKAAGVIEPQLFTEKYLPSQKEVRLMSNFEMAYAVIEKTIRSKKGNKGKNVRPAIEAVFLKMLSNEMKRQTFGFKNYRHQWLQAGAKGAEEKIDLVNEQIRQILSIPTIIEARNKGDAEKYRWSAEYNNIRETQNIVYGLQEKVGSPERPTIINKWRLFSDNDYNYAVKSWTMDYMEKRWDLFGFTIREARNTLSGINFEQLPEDELEQFIFVYNQYNPTRKIDIDPGSKKPLIEVGVVDGH